MSGRSCTVLSRMAWSYLLSSVLDMIAVPLHELTDGVILGQLVTDDALSVIGPSAVALRRPAPAAVAARIRAGGVSLVFGSNRPVRLHLVRASERTSGPGLQFGRCQLRSQHCARSRVHQGLRHGPCRRQHVGGFLLGECDYRAVRTLVGRSLLLLTVVGKEFFREFVPGQFDGSAADLGLKIVTRLCDEIEYRRYNGVNICKLNFPKVPLK